VGTRLRFEKANERRDFLRVSPEEFLQRMASSETAKKTASSEEKGGQFSMPAHPKASTGTGMVKDKVCVSDSFQLCGQYSVIRSRITFSETE
jgi:hypothetical protein